jgi:hypothetical protein
VEEYLLAAQHLPLLENAPRRSLMFALVLKSNKMVATFEFCSSLFARLTKYDERHKQKFNHWFAQQTEAIETQHAKVGRKRCCRFSVRT